MDTIQQLKRIIESTGVGIAELAKKAGVTRQTLYNILDGASKPTLATVERVCEALGVQIKLEVSLSKSDEDNEA